MVCVWAASTIIADGCHPQGVPRSAATQPPGIAVASGGAHGGRPWVDLAPGATAGSIAIDVGDAQPLQTGDPKRVLPHAIYLAPATVWPAGIAAVVALEPGAPSREGPRTSTRETARRFSVAPPFSILGLTCHEAVWVQSKPKLDAIRCPARGSVAVELSNPVDPASHRARLVQIVGEPPADHTAWRDSIRIETPDVVGRTYTIAVAAGLIDIYGQPLVGRRQFSFTTLRRHHEPVLLAPTGLIVLDPRFEIPQWVIGAQSIESLRIQLYQVEPNDYFAYLAFEQHKRATPPGRKVHDETHAVDVALRASNLATVGPAGQRVTIPAGQRAEISEHAAKTADDTRWDFRNLRDERSEVFAMELRAGTHRFSYTARATTPGAFIAAPARAEEMYSPETFGRSTGQRVVVE